MIAHNLTDREYLALNGTLSLDRIERLLDRDDELEKLYQDLVDFWTDEMVTPSWLEGLPDGTDFEDAIEDVTVRIAENRETLKEILEI